MIIRVLHGEFYCGLTAVNRGKSMVKGNFFFFYRDNKKIFLNGNHHGKFAVNNFIKVLKANGVLWNLLMSTISFQPWLIADAGFFNDLFIQRQPSLSVASDCDEVNEYLNENETEPAANDLEFDLMQYWKRKSTKWPRHCLVARDVLNIFSVPASSTSSERVFSLAGYS